MKPSYFSLARNASRFSDFRTYKIGCIAVYRGKVISVGYNCSKTHPIQQMYSHNRGINKDIVTSVHAEIYALAKIRNLNIDWEKVSLYVFREHKDGSLACARPCNACMTMIKDLGIKNIYYTQDDGWCHEEVGSETVGKLQAPPRPKKNSKRNIASC